MSEELREKIARKLCDMLGGDPDAVAFDPHDSWEGPLWSSFVKDADSILALIDHLEADGGVEAMREALVRISKVQGDPISSDIAREALSALPVLGVGR